MTQTRRAHWFDNLTQDGSSVAWYPAIDVSENGKKIKVRAHLPGVDPNDIKLTIENDRLTLVVQKRSEKQGKGEDGQWTEHIQGSFWRAIQLPENTERKKVRAKLKNGVLEITLSKRPEAKPREIPVEMN
jgi:HSP20 family protein